MENTPKVQESTTGPGSGLPEVPFIFSGVSHI